MIPQAISPCPMRTICTSLSFIARKPFSARPAVMPMKNMLAKEAAISAGTPLYRVR